MCNMRCIIKKIDFLEWSFSSSNIKKLRICKVFSNYFRYLLCCITNLSLYPFSVSPVGIIFHKNSNAALEKCKKHIELIANTLQLEGFSRIDAFVNVDSGDVSRDSI